jgi:hypothetical protein
MRVITYLGPKNLRVSVTLSLIVGGMAWMSLPYSPRVVIPAEYDLLRVAYSKDCRLVAITQGDSVRKGLWKGEIHLWDTHERRILFSIPHSRKEQAGSWGRYSMHFTPEDDKLVIFGWGEAKFYDFPSGEPWEPDAKHIFRRDGERGSASLLIHDAQGKLFVLVYDAQKKRNSICDLLSGREISSWPSDGHPMSFPGATLAIDSKVQCKLNEIPTGRLRLEFTLRGPGHAGIVWTPDGRTVVEAGRPGHIWIDGERSTRDLDIANSPAVSPDGRFLAGNVHSLHAYPDWLAATLAIIGIRLGESAIVIYDLRTGQQAARLPRGGSPHFSLDGGVIAVATEESLELYDSPLRKPWGKIVCLALGCAGVVFLMGQWIRWRRRKPIQPAIAGETSK